jgi:phosphinothricin acetyltransferase
VLLRAGRAADLPALTAIVNHYIVSSPATFDVQPYQVEEREPWLAQFGDVGPHRLIVAEEAGEIRGYAASFRWRPKAAYDTTVEVSIYCHPDARSRGLGRALGERLLGDLAGEDVHRAVGGVTLPNPASTVLLERLGFRQVGVFSQVGRKLGQYWDVAWFERALR